MCAVWTLLNSEGVAVCTQLGAQTMGGSGLGPVQLDCCVPSPSLVKSTYLLSLPVYISVTFLVLRWH